jgi:putative membrane protein
VTEGPASAVRPWDPGLQPERTALAWRRTGLALTVGSLIGLRVLPPLLGPAAYLLAGLGVVASLAVLAAAHRRYRRVHRLLLAARVAGRAGGDDGDGAGDGAGVGAGSGAGSGSTSSPARVPTTGGALPAATAALALAAGLAALVVALGVR